jgi:hypothetical protein
MRPHSLHRIRFGLFIVLVVGLMAAVAPTASAAIVSYWTFDDGTANDTISTNNGAFGSKATSYTPGILGKAVDLAGQPGNDFNANVTIPGGHTLNTATSSTKRLTMEAWFQADDIHTNTYTEIMRQQDPGYRFLSFQGNGTKLAFNLAGTMFSVNVTPASFENGQWHHVAVTYDGTAQRIYIDGQLKGTNTVALTLPSTSPPAFVIGNLNVGSTYSEAFDGRMDEVAVWNEALSADEIAHQYINRQSYTTRLAGYNTATAWNVHDDWDPADGIPNDPPAHAWHYQKLSGGQYSDLSGWGTTGFWTGGNARTDAGGYPVVGPRIGNFDHQESTVDAYIAANGLAQMKLIDMHPDSSEDAVVTWRNPVPGTNDFVFDGVYWHIDATDSNGVGVSISRSGAFGSGDALVSHLVTGLTADTVTLSAGDANPDSASFSFRLTLNYGDELHFRVNALGGHGSDATMFGLNVAQVPEPSTALLGASGLALLLGGLGLRGRRGRWD